MEIKELQIKHFGKFRNQSIRFHGGVNILYGENEMGKSTLHAFIRAILFGMEKERGRASKNNEYILHEPWDNPSYYAGTIRFESRQKVYRLTRNFSEKEKSAELFCETDGVELSADQEHIRELLDGFSEAAFCNTVFVGQRSSETASELADEIRNFVTNYQEEGTGELNVREALSQLKERRQDLERKRKQQQDEKTEKIKQTKEKIQKTEKVLSELRALVEEQNGQLIQKRDRRSQFIHSRQETERKPEKNMGLWMAAVLFQVLFGGLAVMISILDFSPWFLAVVAGVDLIVLVILFLQIQTKKQRAEKRNLDQQRKEEEIIKKMELEEEKLNGKQEIFQEEIRERMMQLGNMREVLAEAGEESEQDRIMDRKIAGLQIAENTIRELSSQMYQEFSENLNETVSDILARITRGRYTKIFLDEKLNIRIDAGDHLLYLYQVSRGTMDQIYFALRMAIGEFFFQEEKLPVILDDVFVMYDDRRLKEVLRWLFYSNRQVLLFTCHKRERELLQEIIREEA